MAGHTYKIVEYEVEITPKDGDPDHHVITTVTTLSDGVSVIKDVRQDTYPWDTPSESQNGAAMAAAALTAANS